jgi:ATP-dependent RNA helicase HelY
VGYAVVLWSPWVPADRVADLAATASYPLTSSFRPDYNMAANLIRRYSRPEAEELLNSSFAQFRTDRDLVRLEATLHRRRRTLEQYLEAARCELGDVEEYRRLRRSADDGRKANRVATDDRIRSALMKAKAGDVFWFPGRRGQGLGAVVARQHSRAGDPKLVVVLREGRVARIGRRDLTGLPTRVATIEIPTPVQESNPRWRKDVATRVAALDPATPPGEKVGDAGGPVAPEHPTGGFAGHPVHACPDRDRHLAFLQRADDMAREIDRVEARVRRRADALTRIFDRVLAVLEALGYVDGWSLTSRGEILAALYSEVDLLVTEVVAEGVFEGLPVEEVAALVSCLTFEPRVEDQGPPLPGGARLREALRRTKAIWRDLVALEEDHGLPPTREPHEGFADYAHRWARGDSLDEVLGDDDLPGGDFVRQAKQVIDLLRQLAVIDDQAPFGEAADRLERGVVAYSSL